MNCISILVAPADDKFAELGPAALGVTVPSQWEPQVPYTPQLGQQPRSSSKISKPSSIRRRIIRLRVKKLEQAGLTSLLVEQNVHLALAVSDYAYVVAEGRVFTEGPPSALKVMPEIRQAYLGL